MLWVLFTALAVLFIVVLVILFTTKICSGGDLFSGCGKLLFPWTKKVMLPSGRYCCINCYVRDLKLFTDLRKDSENLDFTFYEKDEELEE